MGDQNISGKEAELLSFPSRMREVEQKQKDKDASQARDILIAIRLELGLPLRG